MLDIIRYIADVVPHFGWLVAVPLSVLVLQLLFLRAALARRRECLALEDAARAGDFTGAGGSGAPRRWLAVVVALSLLAIPAVAVWSIASARALCLTPVNNPSLQAEAFSRGLGGMFNVVPWSVNLLVPSVLLATLSLSLWVSTHRRRLRLRAAASLAHSAPPAAAALLRRPSVSADELACVPLLFLSLGLFPVLSGAWAHAIRLIQGYAGAARLPAAEKAAPILASLDDAHARFAARAWLAHPGVAIAVLVSALLVTRWRKQRKSDVGVGTLSWKATLAWSGVCLAIALALFRLAAPFRAENNLPWPAPRLAGDVLRVDQPDGPQLDGPDEIERCPVLQISRGRAWLDGYAVDVDELGDALRTARQTHKLLHPDERYAGVFVVLAPADTPTGTVAAYLTAAARAGSPKPLFAFTRRESQDRPILGPLTRVVASAVRATVLADGDEPEEGVVLVRAAEHAHYGGLAHRLVTLRRGGQVIGLAL